MSPEVRAFLAKPWALIITKANVKSRVHRRAHLDYVGVKLFARDGTLEGELRIVGLFTASAYTNTTGEVPYLRHQVAKVVARAGFDPASYAGRALLNVLESFPRDELFQVDDDTLYRFALDILNLSERPRVRALARPDEFDRFVSVIVFIPKDRYDSQIRRRVGEFLAGIYDGRVSAAYPAYPEGPLARTHYIIGRDGGGTPTIDRETLERGIAGIVRTWGDSLRDQLADTIGGPRARALAARYGVERVHTDVEALLADDGVQAVSLCTANASHAELAVAVLQAGRHVLVEKPLATTLADALAVERAAAASGCVAQVGFVRRFSGNVVALKRFVDAGELGEVYYGRATNLRRAGHPGGWYGDRERSGGGPLIDIGSHVLDLCWYLMGRPEPVTVTGNTYARLGERNGLGPRRYRAADAGQTSSVEDLANASIRFANGASLLLDASYSLHAPQDRLSVSIHGEAGGADVEPELRLATERHGTMLNLVPQIDHRTFDLVEGFRGEIHNFVQACLGREDVLAPVQDGVQVTRMVAAVYASAAAGHEVRLDGRG
jgi:predicted dehydrogenase